MVSLAAASMQASESLTEGCSASQRARGRQRASLTPVKMMLVWFACNQKKKELNCSSTQLPFRPRPPSHKHSQWAVSNTAFFFFPLKLQSEAAGVKVEWWSESRRRLLLFLFFRHQPSPSLRPSSALGRSLSDPSQILAC